MILFNKHNMNNIQRKKIIQRNTFSGKEVNGFLPSISTSPIFRLLHDSSRSIKTQYKHYCIISAKLINSPDITPIPV